MRKALLPALVATIAFVAPALASPDGSLVPPTGTVSGDSYGQWLGLAFQSLLDHPANAKGCTVAHRVPLLLGSAAPVGRFTCHVKPDQPLYAIGLANECSTIENQPSYARTPSGLIRCAKRNFSGVSRVSFSIDGHRFSQLRQYVSASPVFSLRLPQNNLLGVKRLSGRAAAYGYGFLITGLAKGRHTIVAAAQIGKTLFKSTFTIIAA